MDHFNDFILLHRNSDLVLIRVSTIVSAIKDVVGKTKIQCETIGNRSSYTVDEDVQSILNAVMTNVKEKENGI